MSSPTETAQGPLARAANAAARRSAIARILSWLAAAIGLGAVVLFLVQAGLFSLLAPKEEIARPVIDNPEEISANNSTVNGLDRQNQPYQVTARRGRQDKDKPNIVYLEEVGATFNKTDGRTYAMSALKGVYDTKIKEMDLTGNVNIREGERFVARMEQAHVTVETKALTSTVPVDVSFAGGMVHANGMQITDDGARILFLNGVKARFGAETAKGDQTP